MWKTVFVIVVVFVAIFGGIFTTLDHHEQKAVLFVVGTMFTTLFVVAATVVVGDVILWAIARLFKSRGQ